MNKKGNVFSIFIIIVILLVVALLGLLFSRVIFGVTDAVGDIELIKNTPTAVQANQQVENANIPVVEGLVFFLFLASFIGLIISAVYTNFSPVIVFLFFLLIIFAIFGGGMASNIYNGLASDSTLQTTSTQLNITNIIFSQYTPLIIAVISLLILIIMYSKSGDDI